MNIFEYQIGKAELLSMMVFTVGCIVDHVTTYYGLTLPTVEEINPVVLLMIGSGIWNLVEIVLIIAGNGSGLAVSGSKSKMMITFSMTSLLIVGIVRLYAGFHNMILIFNIVRALELSSAVL
jgi:hypothetical protein